MAHLIFITGGSRSGKSAHALAIADALAPAARRFFIATAEALDPEMAARIAHHRDARGHGFATVEEPIALVPALVALEGRADFAILDCLTLWISNLMGRGCSDEAIMREADALTAALRDRSFQIVVVSDEVGSGIVPDHPAARRFRDLLGWTNQKIARAADEAILMASGYPIRLK